MLSIFNSKTVLTEGNLQSPRRISANKEEKGAVESSKARLWCDSALGSDPRENKNPEDFTARTPGSNLRSAGHLKLFSNNLGSQLGSFSCKSVWMPPSFLPFPVVNIQVTHSLHSRDLIHARHLLTVCDLAPSCGFQKHLNVIFTRGLERCPSLPLCHL